MLTTDEIELLRVQWKGCISNRDYGTVEDPAPDMLVLLHRGVKFITIGGNVGKLNWTHVVEQSTLPEYERISAIERQVCIDLGEFLGLPHSYWEEIYSKKDLKYLSIRLRDRLNQAAGDQYRLYNLED